MPKSFTKQASKAKATKKTAKGGQTKEQRIKNLEKARAARGTSPFAKMTLAQLEAAKAKSTDPKEQTVLRRYIRSARRAAGMPIPSEERKASAEKPKGKGKAAAQKSKAEPKGKPAKGKASKKTVQASEDEEDEDF